MVFLSFFLRALRNGLNHSILFVLILFSSRNVLGFTAQDAKASIKICPVTSFADVMALADLRYQEWIASDNENYDFISKGQNQRHQPSLKAFRMATADIHSERKEQGAIAFVAIHKDNDNVAVGCAELSPIELCDCYCNSNKSHFLYITDVVTSRRYRRQGIGNKLLNVMEQEAVNRGVSRLYLHVDKLNNDDAFQFYIHNGYAEYNNNQNLINPQRLAENAGTVGQSLLTKELRLVSEKKNKSAPVKRGNSSAGFGNINRKKQKV